MASIKFIQSSITFTKDGATLKIPASLAKALYGDAKPKDKKKLFVALTNGVIQCSVEEPAVTIPAQILDKQYFVKQD